jgi:hypothetical protein
MGKKRLTTDRNNSKTIDFVAAAEKRGKIIRDSNGFRVFSDEEVKRILLAEVEKTEKKKKLMEHCKEVVNRADADEQEVEDAKEELRELMAEGERRDAEMNEAMSAIMSALLGETKGEGMR